MSTLKLLLFEILMHMRSTNPGRYLIFFLIKFPFECRQNHVWRPIVEGGRKEGREEGRKGGREEVRKGGREEGRKRGRKEGRKGGREE